MLLYIPFPVCTAIDFFTLICLERDDEAVHRIKELAIYKLGRIFQKEG